MRPTAYVSINRCIWAALASASLAASGATAQQPVAWKTGAAFTRQLRQEAGVTWQERSLREGLDRLSRAYGIAVFLDRRIDPDQHVDFTASDIPLETLWQKIAAAVNADTAIVGSVVYIGPRETASQLAAIAAQRRQDVTRLSNDAKARLLKTEAWQWDELAQPRDLLCDLARQGGVAVENADAIPHDLLPAVDLPPLIWVDRMTLLLAGFGLTCVIDDRGTVVRLVPLRTTAVADRRLAAGQSAGASKSAKKGGEKLYSLKVANEPAGNVIGTIAKSLGKQLSYDPEVLDMLKQRVTFDLKDATLDHLMQTTLKPLRLTYRLTEKDLEIVAAK
jgi:hypothetical protein